MIWMSRNLNTLLIISATTVVLEGFFFFFFVVTFLRPKLDVENLYLYNFMLYYTSVFLLLQFEFD